MYIIKETVTPSRTDKNGNLKLFCALQMMQDCSEMWLCSEPEVQKYFQENGIAQLLASRQIEILRIPKFGEKLEIATSIFGCKNVHGFRNTIVRDEQGNPCYATWSVGVFVFRNSGSIAKIPENVSSLMKLDEKYEMQYLGRKISLPEIEFTSRKNFDVQKNDIDYNLHVNNAQYARMACELLPENFEASSLRVEYKIPAKYGDTIHAKTALFKGEFFYVLLQNSEGKNFAIFEFARKKLEIL